MRINIFRKLFAVLLCAALLCSCAANDSGTAAPVTLTESLTEALEAEYQTVTEDFSDPQLIDADSPALEYINSIEGNPYKVSLEITADGRVEENLYASESGYSYVISSNKAVLGLVPEFYLGTELTVTDTVVKFTLDDTAAKDGIDKYMIFMYFEDINTLLPIETFYDNDTNTVYARTDRLGTYCVMDTEKWLSALAENTEYAEAPNEPGNIIFCIDPRMSLDEAKFDTVKNDIKYVFEDAWSRYENMKLYVYYQQNSGGEVVHTLLSDEANGRDFFAIEDYFSVVGALDSLESSMIKCDEPEYDFAAAVRFMLSTCDENIVTIYHVVADGDVILDDADTERLVRIIGESKFLKRDGDIMDRLYISTLCYSDSDIIPEGSNFHKLAEASNGMVYCTAENAEQ